MLVLRTEIRENQDSSMNGTISKATIILLAMLYVVFIVIFGALTPNTRQKVLYLMHVDFLSKNTTRKSVVSSPSFIKLYSLFQNVQVMVLIGFGFLMTYLKKYGRSSLGFSFLLSCFVIMWYIIVNGLYNIDGYTMRVGIISIINAELAAAAFLISFGVVLGKLNILQLYLMAFIETVLYETNKYLIEDVLLTSDPGGSVGIHTFGAFYGLGITLVHGLRNERREYKTDLEKSSYESDISSVFGTLLLWVFWPSFNAISTSGIMQYRAIMNTYIALVSSCIAIAVFTIWVSKSNNWKLSMVYIQNATLAAGVAVGSCAPLNIFYWEAMLLGLAGAGFSVAGYRFVQDFMAKKLRMHDTCGVFSLHGLPGIIAGLSGSIMLYIATTKNYGFDLYLLYPAMMPIGKDRSRVKQGLFQLCSLICTMGIGFVGGLITGALIVLAIPNLTEEEQFTDEENWQGYED